LRVANIERSKTFYSKVLGFEVVEQDPEHGGVFMSLGEYGHTLDLSPIEQPETAVPVTPNRLGVHHIAFMVESEQALRDAYFALEDQGIEVVRAIDHVSQKSIYFHDPDGNRLEIYCASTSAGSSSTRRELPIALSPRLLPGEPGAGDPGVVILERRRLL
jgi:catechol-2,3-dioxygenase